MNVEYMADHTILTSHHFSFKSLTQDVFLFFFWTKVLGAMKMITSVHLSMVSLDFSGMLTRNTGLNQVTFDLKTLLSGFVGHM